jgi:hypothetical protein
MPTFTETGFGGLNFDIGLTDEKQKLCDEIAWELVKRLSAWFIIASARVTMQIADDDIDDRSASIIRRFWMSSASTVRIVHATGHILVERQSALGTRVIDFEVYSS